MSFETHFWVNVEKCVFWSEALSVRVLWFEFTDLPDPDTALQEGNIWSTKVRLQVRIAGYNISEELRMDKSVDSKQGCSSRWRSQCHTTELRLSSIRKKLEQLNDIEPIQWKRGRFRTEYCTDRAVAITPTKQAVQNRFFLEEAPDDFRCNLIFSRGPVQIRC